MTEKRTETLSEAAKKANAKVAGDLATFRRRMDLKSRHGDGTPKYYEALRKEGLLTKDDEKAIKKKAESATNKAPKRTKKPVSSSIDKMPGGGLQARIAVDTMAVKESGINDAIASLGNRKGDEPAKITRALKKALRERDLGLDQDVLEEISSLLAKGKTVNVGVDS